jgi:benzoate/toluate 1,2-dioxygenase alpha subunit
MRTEELPKTLVDDPRNGRFQVSRRVFTEQAILDQELENIFEGHWIYMAHESQLPDAGDFFSTYMGRQPVFLVRGKDQKIRAFLNSCAHRGATVCRTEKGKQNYFTCPYHGWVYDHEGKNLNIKEVETGGYPESFLKASHDLTPVAKVENYRGFIFGSLNPDAPPFLEYLGEARTFVDLFADQSPEGLEVVKGASVYTYRGNWKLQAENGIDGYHFTTVHANYVGILQKRIKEAQSKGRADAVKAAFNEETANLNKILNGCYDLGQGHALIWIDFPLPQNRPNWERREEITQRVGEVRAQWILNRQRNLLLFPNVQLMDQASTQIRVFRPLAPDLTEVKIYCVGAKGESAEARERRIRQYEDFFNATGMATPDDLAEFEGCAKGYEARTTPVQGYERGMTLMVRGPDQYAKALGVNPVASGHDAQDEVLYYGFYRTWANMLGLGQ